MRRLIPVLLFGLGIGAGVAVSELAAPDARAENGLAAHREVPRPTADRGLTASDVRRILRQELATIASPSVHDAPVDELQTAAEEVGEPPELAAERDHAYVEVTRRVDEAWSEGAWDDDDARFVRARLARMRPEDGQAVREQIMVALNAGEIEDRLRDAPF